MTCLKKTGARCTPWMVAAILVLALAACTPTPVPDLTLEELGNLTYAVEVAPDGKATLVNGSFSVPAAPNSATQITVDLTDESAFGDLDGDGVPDAAAILVALPGGSGSFYYLYPVLNQDGTPDPLAPVLLGDRVELRSLSIESEQIHLEMIMAGPNDPLCCPTLKSVRTYALSGDTLELVDQTDSTID